MKSPIRCTIVIFACLSLVGCGSKIEVTPVDSLSPVMSNGVYYTLPKTVLEIKIPFQETVYTKGKYAENFDYCVAVCSGSTNEKCSTQGEKEEREILYRDISISTQTKEDPNFRYSLDVEMDTFSEFSHVVKLTPEGILTSTESTVGNPAPEIALEVLRFVGSIVPFFALKESVEISKGSDECKVILAANETLKEHQTRLDQSQQKIQEIEKKKASLFEGKGLDAEIAVLEKAIGYYDGWIVHYKKAVWSELKEEQVIKTKKALALVSTQEKSRDFVVTGKIEPKEFTPVSHTDAVAWELYEEEITKIGDDKSTRLTKIGDVDSDDFVNLVVDQGYNVSVQPPPWYLFDEKDIKQRKELDKKEFGLRYRLPAKAEIVLNNSAGELAKTEGFIAQYGPLAFLPTKFKGSEQKLNLAIYPETGGIKEVTIGVSPLSTETMKDTTTVISDSIEEYEGRELIELENKKNKLDYQKSILELEAEIEELEAKKN